MSDKARILTIGFSDAEQGRIDARLSGIVVPAPTRLLNRHGSVVIGDILREGTIRTEELA